MPACGLYIHIPFCQTKCGYCDFYSVALNNRPTSPLIERIVAELRRRTDDGAAPIRTVFIGGGTPTILPVAELRRLLGAVREVTQAASVAEFTVEANPATLDDETLSVLIAGGVDRISLGAQAWRPEDLAVLERLHNPQDTVEAVAAAGRHGIGRISLDIIFGIPGQTLDGWRDSLRRTIDTGVGHVSAYGLTYEPGTRLTAQLRGGRIARVDEGLEADMYLLAIDVLGQHGYAQYEISNFAQPGQQCLHNMIYWRNEPYIGVGPSACGYIDGERYANVSDVASYIRRMDEHGCAEVESERVAGATLAGETIMMGLRLNEGIDLSRFIDVTGVDPRWACRAGLRRFSRMGLIDMSDGVLSLSRRGRLFADSIIADLYAELHQAQVGADRPAHGPT